MGKEVSVVTISIYVLGSAVISNLSLYKKQFSFNSHDSMIRSSILKAENLKDSSAGKISWKPFNRSLVEEVVKNSE